MSSTHFVFKPPSDVCLNNFLPCFYCAIIQVLFGKGSLM